MNDTIPTEDSSTIRAEQPGNSQVVGKYVPKEGSNSSRAQVRATKGRPRNIVRTAMRSKRAYGGGGTGGGLGTFPSVASGMGGNLYSSELSTDFLQLAQSIDEERNFHRFFAENDPQVAQAISQHVELPLSKVRIGKPRRGSKEMSDAAMRFCEWWVDEIDLSQYLLWIAWEWNVIGEVFIFLEDTNPKLPPEVRHTIEHKFDGENAITMLKVKPDADKLEYEWLQKNYRGFTGIKTIPPEQIHMESFPLTDAKLFDFVPDAKLRSLINKADANDPRSQKIVDTYPAEFVAKIRQGANIPLDTDPDTGSYLCYLSRKKYQYAQRGQSLLKSCMRDLIFYDKLRQAQTSIADRHMTPMRIVWSPGLSATDVDDLREQIDLALMDPDFSIVANYEVNWEEMGSNDRLLDLTGEYDLLSRRLYAGLGVTESMLSGESSYSGEKTNLEVINTRYMLFREMLQRFVENKIFKPMCKRMGFIETIDGREEVVHPTLSFTRMGIRDSAELQDFVLNLYNKNAMDLRTVLEINNFDPDLIEERLKNDSLTIRDALWNEMIRSLYNQAGNSLAENSDVVQKFADQLGVTYKSPKPSRF